MALPSAFGRLSEILSLGNHWQRRGELSHNNGYDGGLTYLSSSKDEGKGLSAMVVVLLAKANCGEVLWRLQESRCDAHQWEAVDGTSRKLSMMPWISADPVQNTVLIELR